MPRNLSAIVLLAAAFVGAEDKPAIVAGVVLDSTTGAPVPRAHVTLMGMSARGALGGAAGQQRAPQGGAAGQEERPQNYGAITDAEGKFVFTSLPPGAYSPRAQRAGFVAEPGIPPRIELQPGDVKEKIEVKLIPTGAITGRVVDADGEPVEGASVRVTGGSMGGSGSTTDENGRFRLGGLMPGRYRVQAQPQLMWMPPEVRSDGTADIHYAATWYPNAVTADGAGPVMVKAGNETSGVEIRLVQTPNVRVSGKVSGLAAASGTARAGQRVQLEVRQSSAGGMNPGRLVAPDGTFEIWGLNPGKYTLRANIYGQGGSTMASAPVEIQVGDSNVDNVAVVMLASLDISGRMELEDDPTGAAPPQQRQQEQQQQQQQPRQIGLREEGGQPYFGRMATISADGSFTLEKVPPGRYRVSLAGYGFHVKTMRLGTTEISGGILDLSGGLTGASLTLAVRRSTGEISGTVNDANGPAEGALVALVGESTRTTPVKPGGKYTFDMVAPGKYKLTVIEPGEIRDVMQGNFDAYKDVVQDVEIGEGEKISKDLKRRREQ